jgi:hypothetical protein
VALAYVGLEPTYGSDTSIAAADSAATPGTHGSGGAGDPNVLATDPNLSANGATGASTAPVTVLKLATQ